LPLFGGHGHSHHEMRCPYKGCQKFFDKPTLLTDQSRMPRESYYACPFCMSKIDIITENSKVVNVKAVDYPATVFESPAKCAHFSGVLGGDPGSPLPDECLICPRVLQCDARKRR
jgi:hypothetical protein